MMNVRGSDKEILPGMVCMRHRNTSFIRKRKNRIGCADTVLNGHKMHEKSLAGTARLSA